MLIIQIDTCVHKPSVLVGVFINDVYNNERSKSCSLLIFFLAAGHPAADTISSDVALLTIINAMRWSICVAIHWSSLCAHSRGGQKILDRVRLKSRLVHNPVTLELQLVSSSRTSQRYGSTTQAGFWINELPQFNTISYKCHTPEYTRFAHQHIRATIKHPYVLNGMHRLQVPLTEHVTHESKTGCERPRIFGILTWPGTECGEIVNSASD